jgi:hypothetical protein
MAVKVMANSFALLFFLSVITLLVGLIRPRIVIRWGTKKTRGRVLAYCGTAIIASLFGFSLTAPPPPKTSLPSDLRYALLKKVSINPVFTPQKMAVGNPQVKLTPLADNQTLSNQQSAKPIPSPTQAQQTSSLAPLVEEGWDSSGHKAHPITTLHEFPPINAQYTILEELVIDSENPPITTVDLFILTSTKMNTTQVTTLLKQVCKCIEPRVGSLSHKHPSGIMVMAFDSRQDYDSDYLRTKGNDVLYSKWSAKIGCSDNGSGSYSATMYFNESALSPPINTQYTTLDEQVKDSAEGAPDVSLDILLSSKMTEDELRNLLNQICDSIKKRVGPHSHKPPESISIYAFSSREDYESAEAKHKWVANLYDTPGNINPRIEFNHEEIKFGLTEDQRKKIAWEAVLAEDRAEREAPHEWTLWHQLMDKYRDQVAKKYGITFEQLMAIELEGGEKHWPMPPEQK